jgi:hypothetical protein
MQDQCTAGIKKKQHTHMEDGSDSNQCSQCCDVKLPSIHNTNKLSMNLWTQALNKYLRHSGLTLNVKMIIIIIVGRVAQSI